MKTFIDKYQDRILGALSCLDRMLFRGYLPIMSGWQMAKFLNRRDLRFRFLKSFLVEQAERVKKHAYEMASKQRRPIPYLHEKIKKDKLAAEIAQRDHVEEGLICIFSVVEPCRTFSFSFERGKPFVASARRKCLFLYFYFMDRDFGLMHIKLQTWFPLQIQVYVNGHEWLARKLQRHGIRHIKRENVFVRIDDFGKAQKFSDRFCSLDWPRLLSAYARKVKAFNPVARDETQIFRALLDGQHMIRGFSNADIGQKLQRSPHLKDITDHTGKAPRSRAFSIAVMLMA